MRDALPFPVPLSERISFLYFDRCSIERDGHCIVATRGQDVTNLPIGRAATLMLGPGTSVSHAAIALLALEGCTVLWCGELGVRLYASSNQRADSQAILRQAKHCLDETRRLGVARALYQHMFDEAPPANRSIEQLRGIEGARVKKILHDLARHHGIDWLGRSHDLRDPLNLAISTATAALYGLVEATVITMGYSPAIGFIHSGDARSFVFDIADTLKFKTVVPMAFEEAASSAHNLESRVRRRCRDAFLHGHLVDRFIVMLGELFGADDRH